MRLSSLYNYLKPPRGFKLTKAGKIFFVFLFGIIVISMATGNNLLYLMLAGILAFMIVSGIESELNLRYLELDRVLPAEIYAGRSARIGYLLRNKRNRSERLILKDISQIKIPRLQRQQTELLHADLTFPKRGRVHLGTIVIATTYPYGLFEKSISFSLDQDILVFPEPLAFNPSLTFGAHDTGGGKMRDSVSHVRPYVPGDPLSAVVWKKQNLGLISRVFEGGSGMSGVVVLMPGIDVEQKFSWAAYIISELHRMGRPFGLALNGYYSEIAFSRIHKIRILEQLAMAENILKPIFEATKIDAQIIYI